VIRRELPDRPRLAFSHSLADQFANHVDKLRMHAYRRRANHGDAGLGADLSRFGIQIVKDFHVIGNETDRNDNDGLSRRNFAKRFTDIRFEPGLSGRPAPALIDQVPRG
jgi:hypothetical protein